MLGTDALIERVAAPAWVGSLKDVLYLLAGGLAIGRAVQKHLAGVESACRERIGSKLDLVGRLAMAAEYRDDQTGGHNRRIARSARILGRALGMDEEACERLFYAAALHDLGKIAIPDRILYKPEGLDPAERQIMQSHASIGAELLANGRHPLLQMAHDVARSHHERWDGGGYPQGLRGEDIPLVGRIVAVCDVFDALTSERPYKRPWSVEDAAKEVLRGSGGHFDPDVVRAFSASLAEIVEAGERTDSSSRAGTVLVPNALSNPTEGREAAKIAA